MTNNDVMKSIRYTLHMKNAEVAEMIGNGGQEVTVSQVVELLKSEDDANYLECSAEILHAFLDGLILLKRGPREDGAPANHCYTATITNNIILRKLRIAFAFKDTDMLSTLRLANFNMTKSELGALFRNKRHAHFVKCGDQLLRNFLKGLSIKIRGRK